MQHDHEVSFTVAETEFTHQALCGCTLMHPLYCLSIRALALLLVLEGFLAVLQLVALPFQQK